MTIHLHTCIVFWTKFNMALRWTQNLMKKKLFILFFFVGLVIKAQLPGSIPKNGLQAFWSFSGNAHDISGNKHDGTVHGAALVSDRFGNKEGAYSFNGTSDNISTEYEGIMGANSRAVSFWAKMTEAVKAMPAVSWGDNHLGTGAGARFGCAFNYKSQGATIEVSDAGITYDTHSDVADGNWHHYVFQFNKPLLNRIEVYQDGVLLTHKGHLFYSTTPINTTGDFKVHFGAVIYSDISVFFKGQLDDIAIYNRILSEKEILSLYNAPDPNKTRVFIKWTLISLAILFCFVLIIWFIRLRVKKLVTKEKEKIQVEKKWYEQENRVLKAQMDPHFIFNALNSIQQFIIVNDNEKAQLYLSTFSQLIRMQLESNTSENISLKQEIEIIKKYLEIESLRFNNAFDYEIVIDKTMDTSAIYIPYFLIQPFVENAIHHGLLPKIGYKELTITIEMKDPKTLACTVEDNGIGRKNSISKETPFKTKSLGVNFVEQRLLIMSKIENINYRVIITDKETEDGISKGTRAVITLPVTFKQ